MIHVTLAVISLVLIDISRSLRKMAAASRRIVFDEVVRYCNENDQVSLKDVLRVIRSGE